jgi:UDP-GlcNAc:undecaprenyl-phosphate/decaprenyl-phosphate GlcNAc-1-phosphate transferase
LPAGEIAQFHPPKQDFLRRGMLTSLAVFIFATIIAFILTPPVKRLAVHFDILDKPDRDRKRHRRLVPLWGGWVIFWGMVLSLALVFFLLPAGRQLVNYHHALVGSRLPWLLASASLLLILGLWDDSQPLPPKVKLLLQLTACLLVPLAGFRMNEIMLPFIPGVYSLWPVWGSVLALGWLLFTLNAFNFIDGLDGLASSQAVISGLCLALGAWIISRQTQDLAVQYQCQLASIMAAATSGAALGFWRFNHFPAKIFLGDAGAGLLGFGLSLSGLILAGSAPHPFVIWFILLTLGWPIVDTIQVVLRRIRRGNPISKADNRHLHHILSQWGFSPSGAVAFIDMMVIIMGVVGLVLIWL